MPTSYFRGDRRHRHSAAETCGRFTDLPRQLSYMDRLERTYGRHGAFQRSGHFVRCHAAE